MNSNNIFKKTFIVLILIVIPLMVTIGAAAWIMLSEERIKPQYNPDSAFYVYLNDQTVTYNGSEQMPEPKLTPTGTTDNSLIDMDKGTIEYTCYKKNSSGNYVSYENVTPKDAGEYILRFVDTDDETNGAYPASDVYFKIEKAAISFESIECDYPDSGYYLTSSSLNDVNFVSKYYFEGKDSSKIYVNGTVTLTDVTKLSVGEKAYNYTFAPIEGENYDINSLTWDNTSGRVEIDTWATITYLDCFESDTPLYVDYQPSATNFNLYNPTNITGANLGAYSNEKSGLLGWIIGDEVKDINSQISVTSDINLTAKWQYISHTLTLVNIDNNDGQKTVTYTIGDLPKTVDNPVVENKYFQAWNTHKGLKQIEITLSNYTNFDNQSYTALFYDIVDIKSIIEIDFLAYDTDFSDISSYVFNTENGIFKLADENSTVTFTNIIDFTSMNNGYYYFGDSPNINGLTTTSYVAGSTYISSFSIKYSFSFLPYVIRNINSTTKQETYYGAEEPCPIVIKYKTAKIGDEKFTIEDAIAAANKSASSSNKVTISFCGSTTNYVETCFTNIDFETDNLNFILNDVYKSEITISSYVTIFVPYEDSLTTKKEVKDKQPTLGYGVFSSLRIFQNTILNFSANSSLIIGAEIDYAQPTTTKVLARGVIVNYGTLNFLASSSLTSYGFLKGGIDNKNDPVGLINVYNGASVVESMSTFDFPGGTTTTAILKNAFPTNAWSLHSISCRSIIYSGASYSAYTWILDVEAAASVISTSGNCLFKALETNNETYIEKWAIPARAASENKDALYTITGSNQIPGQRDIIKLKGKYTDNKFGLNIEGVEYNSSPSIALPLGFMDITLLDGSQLTLGNASYLFMPGSINTINEGATLTVNSGINISFADYTNHLAHTNATSAKTDYDYKTYCVDKDPAKLIVNGKLTCNGNIGGYISTNSENSELIFTNATLKSSFESLFCAYGATEDSGYVTYKVTGFYAYGLIYDGSTSKITNFNKTTYNGYLNNDEYCWSGSHGNTTDSIYGSVSGATKAGGGCITEDTLITLADGTQKMVKDLLSTDLLLAFNHITGKFEVTPIAYIICHDNEDVNHRIIQLNFDDGTNIKIISEHVFFDVELNKYVAITEDNVDEFINHHFTKFNESNEIEHIKLVSYDIYYEVTRSYEVVTYSNLVAITNSLVSASAYIDPLLNVFEFNSNYQYDEEKMIDDINKYGLFTYEEFSHLITQDVFNMHNVAYLKVAVGKGIMTWEDIIWLINAYYLYTD